MLSPAQTFPPFLRRRTSVVRALFPVWWFECLTSAYVTLPRRRLAEHAAVKGGHGRPGRDYGPVQQLRAVGHGVWLQPASWPARAAFSSVASAWGGTSFLAHGTYLACIRHIDLIRSFARNHAGGDSGYNVRPRIPGTPQPLRVRMFGRHCQRPAGRTCTRDLVRSPLYAQDYARAAREMGNTRATICGHVFPSWQYGNMLPVGQVTATSHRTNDRQPARACRLCSDRRQADQVDTRGRAGR